MIVRCTHRHGAQLPADALAGGNTPDSRFPVTFDRDYVVFGICLWREGVLYYLVVNDENNRPDWIPACLFRLVDGRLPFGWVYSYWRETSGFRVDAIWGYAELVVSDGKHYDALIEREPEALAIFDRRRAEIESDVACQDEMR